MNDVAIKNIWDPSTGIDALETADDGNLAPLVDLIVKLQRVQFIKAAALSETALTEREIVKSMLGNLVAAAEKKGEKRRRDYEKVFESSERSEERFERNPRHNSSRCSQCVASNLQL